MSDRPSVRALHYVEIPTAIDSHSGARRRRRRQQAMDRNGGVSGVLPPAAAAAKPLSPHNHGVKVKRRKKGDRRANYRCSHRRTARNASAATATASDQNRDRGEMHNSTEQPPLRCINHLGTRVSCLRAQVFKSGWSLSRKKGRLECALTLSKYLGASLLLWFVSQEKCAAAE